MKLTIAHSPDSDDAYMMAPLALGWMDPEGFEIEFIRKDIEQLNAEATEGRHDVTAISFGAYPELRDRYDLLTAGSSIQEGTGPLVVSRMPLDVPRLRALTIAIPGRRTSAYLSMRKWCAEQGFEPAVELLPFDEILPAVVEGRFEAGLLIHESQLMYHDAGLRLVVDLGAWWKHAYDLPLPMGGNAIRKELPADVKQHFATLMRRSVELARARHWESVDYSQSFGRGMDREMIGRYVNAWVNDFTVDPGARGRQAVELLLGLEPVWIQG
ncbi:MAG: ABC transporter substrate-binding protein [Holophagaceae bacterium]|uniref:1,4-dihydroxy-6-naphtoate synthase n=1 Tax=Candidatus Geothrix odensensis TaxID=2954440 RepID=A0A936F1G3_9BACT|nr:ABC transporter substrate-binding protein [Candidatus Geothrix odensensis]